MASPRERARNDCLSPFAALPLTRLGTSHFAASCRFTGRGKEKLAARAAIPPSVGSGRSATAPRFSDYCAPPSKIFDARSIQLNSSWVGALGPALTFEDSATEAV